MKTFKIFTAFLTVIAIMPAAAEDITPQKLDPRATINKYANDICIQAELGGSSHKAKADATISAKLNALLKRLADGDGTLAASYEGELHSGVLKEQVLDTIRETNDCRKHVFDSLVERLIPKAATPPLSTIVAPSKLTPEQAYLIATHPTKVAVKDLSFSNFRDDNNQNFVSVNMENPSEIPAKDTTIEIVIEKQGIPLTKSQVLKVAKSKYYFSSGTTSITIPAKSTSEFPIISVDELVKVLSINNHNFCLYDASPSLIDLKEEIIASNKLQYDLGATELLPQPMISQRAIRIRIKYHTIFDETITKYEFVYAHFTERFSKGWVFYPSTKQMSHVHCIDS